jgi:hypothetical protein
VIKRRAGNKQRWLCFKGFSHTQLIANLDPVRETYAEVSLRNFLIKIVQRHVAEKYNDLFFISNLSRRFNIQVHNLRAI